MKLVFVLGTRPEIIKMVPIIQECKKRKVEHFILHTGQHYDYLMDKVFFEEFKIIPDINLNVGSGTHAETTGKIITRMESILIKESPDCVLVQGDTNSTLSGSLVANKLHIKLGHIEAGIRSYDRRMPEEYNRVVVDHISDFLFAPTKKAKINLYEEGLTKHKNLYFDGLYKPRIFVTGNTIVDVINQNIKKANKKRQILNKLDIEENGYFLITVHREENVDYKERFFGILEGIRKLSKFYDLNIIYPIHPRSLKRIAEFGFEKIIKKIKNLKIIQPLCFLDFLALESNARCILTDSGGVQEEACSLRVPCVVLRDRTDRPEAIDVGAGIIAGCKPQRIFESVKIMMEKRRKWGNPFGDGKAGKRIVNIITRYL